MASTYDQALEFLFPRTTTIKFGLATTRALLRSVGNPHEVVPAIHVGGTNGKGSVCTLVVAALREAGWRVGLYTSPHLVSFRERIQVDGVPIAETAVAKVLLDHPELRKAEIPAPLKWAGVIVASLFTMGVGAMAVWLVGTVSAMQVTLARMDERMANQATVQDSRFGDFERRISTLESYHREDRQ